MLDITDEQKTMQAMISLYCKKHHQEPKGLCQKCNNLFSYASKRLFKCLYILDKPICTKCKTHCYKPEMREMVRKVMRDSGPRMLLHHPILAIDHLIKLIKKS